MKDQTHFHDLCRLRSTLEAFAVRRWRQSADRERVSHELRSLLRELKGRARQGEYAAFHETDQRFHRAIVVAAGLEPLLKCWEIVAAELSETWTPRGSVAFPDWEFDEHMMVELRDGRLWMLARTKNHPHESFSTDQGATWSAPKPAASVQNVNARFFLRRLASGRILLVKNGSPGERLARRSHLSAFLSEDDGKTWRGGLLLDERASVSYPDGFQAPDGLIYTLYDWNRHTDAEIPLAKFREEDILAGRAVSRDARLRLLANKATGPIPERLYNGIELPLEWPPRTLDPNSTDPLDDLSLLACFHDAAFLHRALEGYQSVRPLPTAHRRRFWLHLLRNMIVKSVIRVEAGYFERDDGFFLIGAGSSGADLKQCTLDRLAVALRGLRLDSEITAL